MLCACLFLISGCATQKQPELYYGISVPKQYQAELYCWESGIAGAQRYLNGFEQGWWNCVELYAQDIRHVSTWGDTIANGWPQFISGVEDGHLNAELQIKRNIRIFGEKRTLEYLQELLMTLDERMKKYD